ncbi:MAG TPA: hypothetical protein VKD22_01845 [Ramlibacter sp.]|nr:hypothetical protein [Ramlibacter sp.]
MPAWVLAVVLLAVFSAVVFGVFLAIVAARARSAPVPPPTDVESGRAPVVFPRPATQRSFCPTVEPTRGRPGSMIVFETGGDEYMWDNCLTLRQRGM